MKLMLYMGSAHVCLLLLSFLYAHLYLYVHLLQHYKNTLHVNNVQHFTVYSAWGLNMHALKFTLQLEHSVHAAMHARLLDMLN